MKQSLEKYLLTRLNCMMTSMKDLKEEQPTLEFSTTNFKDEELLYMISKSLQKSNKKE